MEKSLVNKFKNMKNILFILLFGSATICAQSSIVTLGGIKITGTALDQVIKWNGSAWIPATLNLLNNVGPIQNTETSSGASISGSDIRLHKAGLNAGGIVTTLPQQFTSGTGVKLFMSDRSTGGGSVQFDDETGAKGAGFEYTEIGGTVLLARSLVSGTVTSSVLTTGVNVDGTLSTMNKYDGNNKTTTHYGLQAYDHITLSAGSMDVTLNSNKYSSYALREGVTLNVPNPSTLVDGIFINFTATNLTGAVVTINTLSAVVDDFWFNGSATSSSVVTIASGTIKTGKLEIQTIDSTKYWVVTIY